jgi:LmbE family N-acetylglucosaminyl deacetylase
MNPDNGNADSYVPDGSELAHALARTTHLGIGAHADDLELLAWPGIASCFASTTQWFTGIVVTDGAGSPRSGEYAAFSDTRMVELRRQEQRNAALRGKYSAQLQLGCSSGALKGEAAGKISAQLYDIIKVSQPEVVYLHNLADSHSTHVATAVAAIAALRQLPAAERPGQVYGVEIWRNLDWLPARYRVELEIDPQDPLQGELLREFDSQVSGGKRYDLAAGARQVANATFSSAHSVDRFEACILAMDLMPLLRDPALAPSEFLRGMVDDFSTDVLGELARYEFK